MNAKDKFWAVIEFALWIIFTYVILYSIKNPVNIWINAIIIVIIGYCAAIACPLIRQSKEFQKVYKRK